MQIDSYRISFEISRDGFGTDNVALLTEFFKSSTLLYLVLYVCKVSLDLGKK